MLLDPFEEQLHSPPLFVELGYGERGENEIVCEKNESLFCVGIPINNAPQLFGIIFLGIETSQDHGLVAFQSGGFVYRMGVKTPETKFAFGACNEEGAGLMESIKPCVIHIATIHDVKGSRLWNQDVEDIDVVKFAV